MFFHSLAHAPISPPTTSPVISRLAIIYSALFVSLEHYLSQIPVTFIRDSGGGSVRLKALKLIVIAGKGNVAILLANPKSPESLPLSGLFKPREAWESCGETSALEL